ncbi:MAG: tRNA pseudouridine(55) synthase TruB [Muribaculaceae bacterium]|nr:tRNA pseudouridine(55) synthase TruB [Muribaculaceae bacterium]
MAENLKDIPLGFLNVYKPKGLTSHDVVARLRRVTHIKQIGHTGTLDPFATGVLPVAIGKATKLIEYLEDDKEYIATVQFGANTDTYDTEGEITARFDKKVSQEDVVEGLKTFEGEISQLPPIFSAIKVNGKKLYEYAREGKEVKIEPRKVFISKIELQSFDEEKQIAKVVVGCSKGTYIRSIAYDLGKLLGCGGYLTDLERTKAGDFLVCNSIELDKFSTPDEVAQNLIYPTKVLSLPIYEMTEVEVGRVSHGMAIYNNTFTPGDIVFLIYSGKIYAVGIAEQNKILVKKVFEVI